MRACPSNPTRSPSWVSSSGVRRECFPRPPQTWIPSSPAERRQTALERADHAGGDAGRMPIHPHHGAERLKPERMRQPPEELVAAIVMDDRLADDGAQRRHAFRQPCRNPATMERKISAACASHQSVSLSIAEAPGRSPAYNMGMHSFAVTEQVNFMSACRKKGSIARVVIPRLDGAGWDPIFGGRHRHPGARQDGVARGRGRPWLQRVA